MCAEVKPATPEYFPRNKTHKDGLSQRCHVCNRAAVVTWVDNNRSRVNRSQKRKYWEKRAAGLHRITHVVGGKQQTKWVPRPAAAPSVPSAPPVTTVPEGA